MATLLNVLVSVLFLVTIVLVTTVLAHSGQYSSDDNSSSNKRQSNLFVAMNPGYPSKNQQKSQPGDQGPKPAAAPDESGYRIPWMDMVPRRDNRVKRVKKLPGGQNGGGHVPPNVKSSIPVDTDATAREARGRDNNRYDVPLIGEYSLTILVANNNIIVVANNNIIVVVLVLYQLSYIFLDVYYTQYYINNGYLKAVMF